MDVGSHFGDFLAVPLHTTRASTPEIGKPLWDEAFKFVSKETTLSNRNM
jgi:hypothetical protein